MWADAHFVDSSAINHMCLIGALRIDSAKHVKHDLATLSYIFLKVSAEPLSCTSSRVNLPSYIILFLSAYIQGSLGLSVPQAIFFQIGFAIASVIKLNAQGADWIDSMRIGF